MYACMYVGMYVCMPNWTHIPAAGNAVGDDVGLAVGDTVGPETTKNNKRDSQQVGTS
jgi:hypothetical protein